MRRLGALQATEVLKFLGGMEQVEAGILRLIDLAGMMLESVAIPRNTTCPVCGG